MRVSLHARAGTCRGLHVEVRGQLLKVGSLLPPQALRTELKSVGLCGKGPLPTGSSYQYKYETFSKNNKVSGLKWF